MQEKFAKALAGNIRLIAESAAKLAVLQANTDKHGHAERAAEGNALVNTMERAERNIAALLMEPGAQFESVKGKTPG